VNNTKRVVHLTSAHPRFDSRIFLKQCTSLSKAGYEVSLIVGDGEGEDFVDGIKIIDVGRASGRLDRIFRTTKRVYDAAIKTDGEIFHFHDPELLYVGWRLKKLGKTVVFDSHEDVPNQILSKGYIPQQLRGLIKAAYSKYEKLITKRLDAVVTATSKIRENFEQSNQNVVDINNFPIWGELDSEGRSLDGGARNVCYIGGLASIRGIREIVEAVEHTKTNVSLLLAGRFSDDRLEKKIKLCKGWSHVVDKGWQDREGVRAILRQSVAGLVTLHPTVNYVEALPIKMFEYMSAGVVVIASNFPLWRDIVEGNGCGICVDPLDVESIAEAIDYLVSNPAIASEMGRRGQQAVRERYNWSNEEKKLLGVYSSLPT